MAPLSFRLSFLFAVPGSPGFTVSLQPGPGNKTSRRPCEVMETKLPGFLGRAESEVGKSGHGLVWGGGCLSTLGREGWTLGWVGHLDPLQSDRLSGGGVQRMFGSLSHFRKGCLAARS